MLGIQPRSGSEIFDTTKMKPNGNGNMGFNRKPRPTYYNNNSGNYEGNYDERSNNESNFMPHPNQIQFQNDVTHAGRPGPSRGRPPRARFMPRGPIQHEQQLPQMDQHFRMQHEMNNQMPRAGMSRGSARGMPRPFQASSNFQRKPRLNGIVRGATRPPRMAFQPRGEVYDDGYSHGFQNFANDEKYGFEHFDGGNVNDGFGVKNQQPRFSGPLAFQNEVAKRSDSGAANASKLSKTFNSAKPKINNRNENVDQGPIGAASLQRNKIVKESEGKKTGPRQDSVQQVSTESKLSSDQVSQLQQLQALLTKAKAATVKPTPASLPSLRNQAIEKENSSAASTSLTHEQKVEHVNKLAEFYNDKKRKAAAEEAQQNLKGEENVGVESENRDKKQPPAPKRPKLRERSDGSNSVAAPQKTYFQMSRVDLSSPTSTVTNWNASEVIKGFLYVGAGFDKNKRCLVNNPYTGETSTSSSSKTAIDKYAEARAKFCKENGIVYFLNMAGSPKQKELRNITYPNADSDEVIVFNTALNDVDSWAGESMFKAVSEGAEFIQKAFLAHVAASNNYNSNRNRSLLSVTSAVSDVSKTPNQNDKVLVPRIFVHCVAGVNRSAFVVIWWLVRYHGIYLRDAWRLVCTRRDGGVFWKDTTLGGLDMLKMSDKEIELFEPDVHMYTTGAKRLKKGKLTNDLNVRENQHLFEFTAEQVEVVVDEKNSEQNGSEIKLTKELLNNSGDVVISAKPGNPYPKILWYQNAHKILKGYYLSHWNGN